jgi:hypothetical protein
VHREVRFLQIQLRSTSGFPSIGPAAIDVAKTTCGLLFIGRPPRSPTLVVHTA